MPNVCVPAAAEGVPASDRLIDPATLRVVPRMPRSMHEACERYQDAHERWRTAQEAYEACKTDEQAAKFWPNVSRLFDDYWTQRGFLLSAQPRSLEDVRAKAFCLLANHHHESFDDRDFGKIMRSFVVIGA